MNEPDFWSDKNKSEAIINECNNYKKIVDSITSLQSKIENNLEMLDLLKTENNDELLELVNVELETILKEVEELDIKFLLNGPYDKMDAILEIHAGAGGTEACDWANMLLRMYTR